MMADDSAYDELLRLAAGHSVVRERVDDIGANIAMTVVTKGAINLFSAEVTGPSSYGRRYHLARYEKGSVMVFPDQIRDPNHMLSVAPEGAAEYVLLGGDVFHQIDEQFHASLATLLCDSLGMLAAPLNLSQGSKEVDAVPIGLGEAQILGTVKNDAKTAYEVTIDNTQATLCGYCEVAAGQNFPLYPGMWFTTTEEAVMRVETLRRQSYRISELLEFRSFASLVFDLHCTQAQEKKKKDKLSIQISAEKARASMTRGIDVLAHVMSGSAMTAPSSSQHPLIAATERLCEYEAIPFSSGQVSAIEDGLRLEDLARLNNFRTRKVILRGYWWNNDHGSLLAFKDDEAQTPVAILRTGNGYRIYDAEGNESVEVTELIAEQLTGTAFAVYRPLEDKKITIRSLIAFGSKNSRRDLWIAVGVAFIGAILGLVTPLTMSMLIDDVIPDADKNQLMFLTLGLIAIAIADATFDITQGIASQRFSGKNTLSIQSAVWDRLLALPTSFFKQYPTGELSNRANGITQIMSILSASVMNAGLSGVFSLVYLVMLFWYSSQLAWMALGLVFLTVLVAGVINYARVSLIEKETDASNKLQTLVYQLLESLGKLRNAGAETHAFLQWSKAFAKQRPIVFRAENLANILATFNSMMPVLSSAIFFATMFFFSDHDKGLSIGQFIAFTSAYASFLAAIMGLTDAAVQMVSTIPLYKNAKPILEAIPERGGHKARAPELKGNIEINNLYFSYDEDGPTILSGVDLSIKAGEFVAIVGGSGSGKSTLMRLLLGFESPDEGTVFFDDVDLASIDVGSVRRQLGVVLQKSHILQGDLYTNVIGSAPLSMEDAWEALELAGLKDDIEAMPMQLHTYLTPGVLSGGQIQRLMIARALVHQPKIMLLDEATSALDNRSQSIVTQSLDDLRVTRIVIAHRLSTVINADRIIYLEKGRIAEQGTYEELLKLNGKFAEMASRQQV